MSMDRPCRRPLAERIRLKTAHGALALSLALAAQSGHAAGVMEWLFGKKDQTAAIPDTAPDGRDRPRVWQIHEFTAIRYAPSEAGAPANQHPAQVQPEGLKQALATIKTPVKGGTETLFTADELSELVGPLAQAFSQARPNEDVILLCTSRSGGFIGPAYSTTARLFVQGGNLNLIVDSVRLQFVDRYRGTGVVPDLSFGSRDKATGARIESSIATQKRSDWIQLPMGTMPAAEPVPMAAPANPTPRVPIAVGGAVPATQAAPGATSPATAPVATPVPVPAPAATAAPQSPRSAAFYDEQEQRLATLKRLRDKGLITEEEFQQKRREVLQGL